ncbi:hypothetical protein C8Q73DRAFT_7767 [Cubamyces lactineus]|nr:hypothetical protein C8Q73DRAFT_7767 [Cubamyces lactineus]
MDFSNAVVARSIVSTSGLSSREKMDVFESTLFAQASVNKKHKSATEDEVRAWYDAYTYTLGSLGWTVQQQHPFTDIPSSEAQGSVHDVVLASLANDKDVDESLLASIQSAVQAFAHAGKDSEAEKKFNAASIASSTAVSFQLAVATVRETMVVLTLWTFFYLSDQEVGSALWHSCKDTTVPIKRAKITMVLNSDVYSQIRYDVLSRLGGADSLIVPL